MFAGFSVCLFNTRQKETACDGRSLVDVNLRFIFLSLLSAPPIEIRTVIYIVFALSMSDTS